DVEILDEDDEPSDLPPSLPQERPAAEPEQHGAAGEDPIRRLQREIRAAIAAGDTPKALALYDRGLAQGDLPIGMHTDALDAIMADPVRDGRIGPSEFIALVKRVGWDSTMYGSPVSQVHAAALARVEAERWFLGLMTVEQGVPGLWLLLRM